MRQKKYGCIISLILFVLWFQCNSSNALKFDSSSIKGTEGFFRVGKTVNGQWWLIDAAGKPFYSKGICAINYAGTPGGRRAKPGPYAETIDGKYNYPEDPDRFVQACFDKMKAWGFNTCGAWTTHEFFNKGMPYTEIIEFFHQPPYVPGTGKRRGLPDIFDPEWIKLADERCKTLCSPLKNSGELIGYYTDNEIGFGLPNDFGLDPGFGEAGRFGFSLLRNVLGLNENMAITDSAWAFLMNRYGSLRKISEAWGINIQTQSDIKQMNQNKIQIFNEAYEKDAQAFREYYAKKYFKIAKTLIYRYDPNHLILGCRFGSPPEKWVIEAMKPYVDIISGNNYRPTLFERYDRVIQESGMPLLIGEFSWNTDLFKKVPLPNEPEGGYSMKERMFRRGEVTPYRMATHSGIVGYTWYRWVQPRSSTERFTDGLVDFNDEPDMHHLMLQKINPLLKEIRIKSAGKDKNHDCFQAENVKLWLDGVRPHWPHVLNFTVRNGKWQEEVFGWQMAGQITEGDFGKTNAFVKFDLNFPDYKHRKGFSYPGGKGQYTVTLTREGNRLKGQFEGIYNDDVIQGSVYGFYFEPVMMESVVTGDE